MAINLRRTRVRAGRLAATAVAGIMLTACGGVQTSTGSGSGVSRDDYVLATNPASGVNSSYK